MRTPLRRRLGALATIFGLSLTVLSLTASPVNAAGQLTCPKDGGWTKVNTSSSGDVLTGDDVLSWTSSVLTYDVTGSIDICIKSGDDVTFVGDPAVTDDEPDPKVGIFNDLTGDGTITPSKGISHVSYRVGECVDTDEREEVDTCDPQLPETGDITLAKVTDGNDDDDFEDIDFHFSIDCESDGDFTDDNTLADLDDADVAVEANAPAITVVADADPDVVCRITELDDEGADDTQFTVDGSNAGDEDSVDVTVLEDDTVAVVARNTFNTSGCVGDCGFIPPPCVDDETTAVNECTGITPLPPEPAPFDVLPQEVVNEPAPPAPPAPAPAAVEGVQQTRPAALARTGLSQGQTMTLALGGALLILGGMCLFGSSLLTPRTRRIG